MDNVHGIVGRDLPLPSEIRSQFSSCAKLCKIWALITEISLRTLVSVSKKLWARRPWHGAWGKQGHIGMASTALCLSDTWSVTNIAIRSTGFEIDSDPLLWRGVQRK